MIPVRTDLRRKAAEAVAARHSDAELRAMFPAPLVILSAPRSGSTLLFETLSRAEPLWSIGTESHEIFAAFPQLHPAAHGWASGALTEADASPELLHRIRAFFLVLARNTAGTRYLSLPEAERPPRITLLEKTPRNALNLPFLLRLFPDLRAIYLHRAAPESIASIAEAWKIGLTRRRFRTFEDLPDWDRRHWCLLLPPGWRALNGHSLVEIAAFQWAAANGAILDGLAGIDRARWIAVDYRRLVDTPEAVGAELARFAGFDFDGEFKARVSAPLPHSCTTVSAPDRDKWRRHAAEIDAAAPHYAAVAERLARLGVR